MQRMQRKFGSYMSRSADESDIGALLHEFNEADRMLETIVEITKTWRDAWSNTLHNQALMATTFDTLFRPIVGASEENATRPPAQTPQESMQRAADLKGAYSELEVDLKAELDMIDRRLVDPAGDARQSLKHVKRMIKAREDRKLDYERYHNRAEVLRKKAKRTDRENVALVKHEADLERSTQEYAQADEHLRSTIPRVTEATFSILPHLLGIQIELQNTLLSQLYTSLNEFCLQYAFPSPPLEMHEIVPEWDEIFTPLRIDLESKSQILIHGKAVQQPMTLAKKSTSGSVSGMNLRNGLAQRRKSSGGAQAKPALGSPAPPVPSLAASPSPSPAPPIDAGSKPRISGQAMAMKPKVGAANGNGTASSASSFGQSSDYFEQRQRISSNSGLKTPGAGSLRPSASSSSIATTASMSSIAGKKKAPPPPPKKIGLTTRAEYVTAVYDFDAQQAGDLGFRTGERIRVLKKTGSTADWWEGELRGVQGSFPANYVSVG